MKIKIQDTDWGKHIPKHVSDEGLEFRTCKQLLQLNCKKIPYSLKGQKI